MKTLQKSALFVLLSLMTACGQQLVGFPGTSTPTVTSTTPASNATGVELGRAVTATFSVPMDPATLNSATFTLKQGETSIPGTVSYAGETAVFSPMADLPSNLGFTATISTGAQSSASHTGLVNAYTWSFTTVPGVLAAPYVTGTDPGNGSTGVVSSQLLTATFNTAMAPSSLNATTFTVVNGTTPVVGAVTYSGTTATFTPAAALAIDSTFTATITTGATDVAGAGLSSNYTWSFTTGAPTTPTVISTNPGNGSTGVLTAQALTATFSTPMKASTITGTTFTLTNGTTAVAGTVTYAGTTATFAPTGGLSNSNTYTATITTGAQDAAGVGLAANYVWSFTTGAAAVVVPPFVVFTDPGEGATGVPTNQVLTVTFNTAMNASTLNTTTFTLSDGTTAVTGTVSSAGTTATFTPVGLAFDTIYTATITTGAEDTSNVGLAANYTWSFTTSAAVAPRVIFTDPGQGATGVPVNQVLTVTFSTPMKPSSINNTSFTLMTGGTPVTGTVVPSGATATFTPTANLLTATTYVATITTDAQDLANGPLAANYTWSFTTVAAINPTVISTTPGNGATGVPVGQLLSVTFSTGMNAASINTTTFTLSAGGNAVTGTVAPTASAATYTFMPTLPLTISTLYTATITTGAKDLALTPLAANYTWTFTTAGPATLTVVSTTPANGATGVATNAPITATFSAPMKGSTVNNTTFTLSIGSSPVAGSAGSTGAVATFVPTNPLQVNTSYIATITTGAQDTAGASLTSNYSWSFTTIVPAPTVTATNPISNLMCICDPELVTATLSERMNPATINEATFTLMGPALAPVTGVVTYDEVTQVATFAPSIALMPSTLYIGTLTTGMQSEDGAALTGNGPTGYTWTFTTGVPACLVPVDLRSLASFVVVAGNGLSNTDTPNALTKLDGDVALNPSATCTSNGMSCTATSPQINDGDLYSNDPAGTSTNAQNDLTSAFDDATGRPAGQVIVLTSSDLTGLTLNYGIYSPGALDSLSLAKNGVLTLDGQGDQNSVWIFNATTNLTVGDSTMIVLKNAAKASNVFWALGENASIGMSADFKGTVMANGANTIGASSTLEGRLLCETGGVTLISNTITLPNP